MNENSNNRFPQGFLWGCGTSPTQVEGETVNEWKDFVARDGTRPDDGPNHWRRYRYDFRCMSDMNLCSYRIGFDWGRLQPVPGAPFDRETSLRYMEMLAELRSLGIEPFLTLFHFNCPQWMAKNGGWLWDGAPEAFAQFAEEMARMTDGEVIHWITINEPAVYALMAYILGEFPPVRKNKFLSAYKVLRNLQLGHAFAYDRIKNVLPDAQVGITKHMKRFTPFRKWHPIDLVTTKISEFFFDRIGLDGFLKYNGIPVSDFLGVNYYGMMRMKGINGVSPITGFTDKQLDKWNIQRDDMWEQDPEWIIDCLKYLHARTGLPLYISESGVATTDEELRKKYLIAHLNGCRQAINDGVDLRGFFYWSLLDNFEFGEGMTKRFGLLSVDFDDPAKKREMRDTARLFGRIARENRLPE